jgi:hypothetical protein
VKRWHVAGGVFLGGVFVIAALYSMDFFGLVRPDDELSRWTRPRDPSLAEPVGEPFGLDDIEAMAPYVDEHLRGLFAEGPPAYSLEQAEAWAAEIIPLVEDVCDRTFESPPAIRVGSRAELADVIARDAHAQYRAAASWLQGPGLDRMVAEYSAYLSTALLGLYDPQGRAINLAPTNVRAIMQAEGIDERHFEPFVKLVIAHEVTHALQDQELDLAVTRPPATAGERIVAWQAAIEGHAEFVQDAVGARLGLSASALEMGRMLSAGAVSPDDPEFDACRRAVGVQYEEIYLGGRDFMAYHHEQGGPERLWEILAAPPRDMSVINRPSIYGADGSRLIDYFNVLQGLEKHFGDDWDHHQNTWVSPSELHSFYAMLDRDDRERVVGSIEHVQMLTPFRYPGTQSASITLLVLRSEADVEPFTEAVSRAGVAEGDPEAAPEAGGLPGVEADDVRRWQTAYDDGSGGVSEYGGVSVRRGRVIVDIRWIDHEMSDEAAAGLVNTVFERYRSIVEGREG